MFCTLRCHTTYSSQVCHRNFSNLKGSIVAFTKQIGKPKSNAQHKLADKMSEEYGLVYNNPDQSMILLGYAAAHVNFGLVASLVYSRLHIDKVDEKFLLLGHYDGTPVIACVSIAYLLFVYLSLRRHVKRMYYNNEKDHFVAIVYGNTVFTQKKINITPHSAIPMTYKSSILTPYLGHRNNAYSVSGRVLQIPNLFSDEFYSNKFYKYIP